MTKTLLCVAALALVACGGKADADKSSTSGSPASSGSAKSGGAASGGAKAAEKPAAPEMVELSLAAVDKSLADYVMMAPKGAKVDGTQIQFGESEFLELSPAPGWQDSIKALADDKLNGNIKKVSETEYRWERTPPIGKMFMVDVLIKVGDANWSCSTGLVGPLAIETADTIEKMCTSITKKKK